MSPLYTPLTGASVVDGSITSADVDSSIALASGPLGTVRLTAGYYYGSASYAVSTATRGTGNMEASPFLVSQTQTFDRIAVEVTSGTATAVGRVGIWSTNSSTGLPGALVLEAGTVDASTNAVKTITISQSLTPGLYWLGILYETAVATYRLISVAAIQAPHASADFSAVRNGFYRTGVTPGALPNPFGTPDGAAGAVGRVMLRAV